jgi:hypothetical protein
MQCLEGGAQHVHAALVVCGTGLAETDQQHALGSDAWHFVQQQSGGGLAVHVTMRDDVAELVLGGLVQRLCRFR